MKFFFPYKVAEIQQPQIQAFYVQNKQKVDLNDERLVSKQLEYLLDQVIANPVALSSQKNFDAYYSIYQCLAGQLANSGQVSARLVQKSYELVTNSLQLLNREISRVAALAEDLKFMVKSYLFLAFATLQGLTPKRTKGKELKEFNSKKRGKQESSELCRRIVLAQNKLLAFIKEVLEQVVRFQSEFSDDVQFYKYFADCALRVLESPGLFREPRARGFLLFLLRESIPRGIELANTSKVRVISAVLEEADLCDNCIDFIIDCEKSQTGVLSSLSKEVLSGMAQELLQRMNLGAQSQVFKNSREFLTRLVCQIPRTFYTLLSSFIGFYESESHYLRNSICDIIAEVIKQVLTGEHDDQGEERQKTKEKYFNILLSRIYDKNALCRSHVVGVLDELCRQNVISAQFLPLLLRVATDRTKDCSSKVRKRALDLLLSVLKMYLLLFAEGNKFKLLSEVENELQLVEAQVQGFRAEQTSLEEKLNTVDVENTDPDVLEQLNCDHNRVKKKIKERQVARERLLLYKAMLEAITGIMDSLCQLLGSKAESDVIQTFHLLQFLYLKNVTAAEKGLKKGLVLIFSSDKKVKQVVLSCYHGLFIKGLDPGTVADNLIRLFTNSTLEEEACLEEWLMCLANPQESKEEELDLPANVYRLCWDKFLQGFNSKSQSARAALKILRISSRVKQTALGQRSIEALLAVMKKFLEEGPDFYLIKEIALIVVIKKQDQACSAHLKNFIMSFIFAVTDRLDLEDNEWYLAAEQVVSAIFETSSFPQKYCELLLGKLTQKLMKFQEGFSQVMPEGPLARTIFVVGHVALRLMVHIDELEAKLKEQKAEALLKTEQQEFDQVMGGIDAEFERKAEQLREVEQNLLKDGLLHKWVPLITHLAEEVSKGSRTVNSELERAAVLSLTKLMCVSQQYCKSNIQLLFRLLNSGGVDSVIKTNIVISLGDLLHKFPNVIEPHNRLVYQNLQDPSAKVRKSTLMVITHLILNDMIRIKSEFVDVALLFDDPDPSIRNLTSLFFYQINKKDPKFIINALPEAIAKLSEQEHAGQHIKDHSFQLFCTKVLQNLQKEKDTDTLIQKLVQKLGSGLGPKQLRNTVLCLTMLGKVISEKGLRFLIYEFEHYRPVLAQEQLRGMFKNLVLQLRRKKKLQVKGLIDELEAKLNSYAEEVFDAEQIKRRKEGLKKGRKKVKSKQRTGRRKGREEQEESFGQSQESRSQRGQPSQPSQPSQQRVLRQRRNRQRMQIEQD